MSTHRVVVPYSLGVVRLPAQVTSFIGREVDIARVTALLGTGRVRLVTVTGPGGVGKTRFALRVAETVADLFRDGVVFVELAAIRDPALVPSAIAHSLGLAEGGDRPVADILAAAMAEQQILLVLDNLEQVTAAAPDLGRLLASCPEVSILATSRTPLRLRGEQRFPLGPLDLPGQHRAEPSERGTEELSAAVRLFVQRAQESDPAFHLDTTNVASVTAICQTLDGLPLAIELAAARIRHLSPQTLLELLRRRFVLLSGGPSDAPERHRSLRDTIAWSDDLLTEIEQTRFRRLAVFRGAFDLDAAAAVWETSPLDALETIAALIDASLVGQRDSGGVASYGLLETVRAYGWERLEATGDADAARERHAAHFSALATRSDTHVHRFGTPSNLDRLDACHDDLRAALAWYLRDGGDVDAALGLVSRLPFFWYYRGYLSEGRRWMHQVLAADATRHEPPSSSARSRAQLGTGLLALVQGDYAAAETWFGASITEWEAVADTWGAAVTRSLLGGVYVSQGRYDDAFPLFQEAMDVLGPAEDQSWAGHSQFHLGAIAFAADDHRLARDLFSSAVRKYDAEGDWIDAIDPIRYLMLIACAQGDILTATDLLTDCFRRLAERGSSAALVPGFADAATLAVAQKEFERAAWLFGASDGLREREGVRLSLPARAAYEHAATVAQFALGDAPFATQASAGRSAPEAEALAIVDALLAKREPAAPTLVHLVPDVDLGLTERELDVLRFLVAGRTNPEIAEELFIGRGTVRTHVSNILAKLGVKTRTEAAHVAYALNLVQR